MAIKDPKVGDVVVYQSPVYPDFRLESHIVEVEPCGRWLRIDCGGVPLRFSYTEVERVRAKHLVGAPTLAAKAVGDES